MLKFYQFDLPITKKGILKSLFVDVILPLFSLKSKFRQGLRYKLFTWEVVPGSTVGKEGRGTRDGGFAFRNSSLRSSVPLGLNSEPLPLPPKKYPHPPLWNL